MSFTWSKTRTDTVERSPDKKESEMKNVYLVANGDLRLSANRICEQAQSEMELKLIASLEREGAKVVRAHQYDPVKKHSFIDSQKYGIEVFRSIPKDAPLVVAEAVWEYTQHILPGLITHQGPILTLANWSGTWPGLVGLLNINASLTKAGVKYSTIWSESFDDEFFLKGITALPSPCFAFDCKSLIVAGSKKIF